MQKYRVLVLIEFVLQNSIENLVIEMAENVMINANEGLKHVPIVIYIHILDHVHFILLCRSIMEICLGGRFSPKVL